MTDHSDLIEIVQAAAEISGDELLHAAASALSSQSLSLSEARAENDRKNVEIERLRGALEAHAEAFEPRHGVIGAPGSFKRWEHDKQKSAHAFALDALVAPALENGPADLADANTNPPLSDLSSLRKGAEVDEPSEDVIEFVARAIHDTDDMANTVWPDGQGDDGYRGDGGYVRLCPNPEAFRQAARQAISAYHAALVSGSREEQS